MTANTITVIISAATLGGGILYTAGQLVAVLKELRRITEDHETRIRLLEVQDPRHARPAERRR